MYLCGGRIWLIDTLGAQGNLPFEMPTKYKNISAILPPSVQERNWIHDGGDSNSAKLDHEGIGEGCHCPGGLYSDEGSTNWNMTNNVVQNVKIWLQGCRPGCPWIGPNWQVSLPPNSSAVHFFTTPSYFVPGSSLYAPLVADV
jgi:hypothetical protein